MYPAKSKWSAGQCIAVIAAIILAFAGGSYWYASEHEGALATFDIDNDSVITGEEYVRNTGYNLPDSTATITGPEWMAVAVVDGDIVVTGTAPETVGTHEVIVHVAWSVYKYDLKYACSVVAPAVTHNVTLTLNGGAITGTGITPVSGGATATMTFTEGTALTLPTTATKAGYTFAGWYTTSAFTGGTAISTVAATVTADTTVYAKWTENHTVTLTLNGGTVTGTNVTVAAGGATATMTFTEGTALTLPTSITKTGFTFGGWFTDAGCTEGNVITSIAATAVADSTVYAKWTAA